MMVQLSTPYTNPEHQNTHHHRQHCANSQTYCRAVRSATNFLQNIHMMTTSFRLYSLYTSFINCTVEWSGMF